MNIDHIDKPLEGKPCQVYFFKTWTTYEHPVTPLHPLHLEEALIRPGYYRAWMCNEASKPQFVLFESMDNVREAIEETVPVSDGVSVYLPRQGANPPQIERPLPLEDIIGLKEYIVSTKADQGKAFLVRQFVVYSYRYRYNPDGSISSTTVTNVDGKVKVLKN